MDEADPAGSTSIYLIAEIAMSGGNLPVASAILFFLEVSMKDSRIPETVLRAISEGHTSSALIVSTLAIRSMSWRWRAG
jgi:hypothetical protein